MFRHIVMWKLKPFADGATSADNAMRMKERLESLRGKIEGIQHLEVGIDCGRTDCSYDVVLVVDFSRRQDLEIYQEHPEHMRVGEFIGRVREARIAVDSPGAPPRLLERRLLQLCDAVEGNLAGRPPVDNLYKLMYTKLHRTEVPRMTKTLPISEARSRLLDLPEEFEKQAGTIIVTRHGKNVLAILPWEFYEAIEETLEVLGDEGLMADLRRSLKEAERGRMIPWEKVKRGLKL